MYLNLLHYWGSVSSSGSSSGSGSSGVWGILEGEGLYMRGLDKGIQVGSGKRCTKIAVIVISSVRDVVSRVYNCNDQSKRCIATEDTLLSNGTSSIIMF